ncbi:MAG: hypothetical protein JOZ93_11715 [Sinobacteraceae bacterium]|nr:hypothetical protein [Nevskiaceae bacterium]
MPHRAPWWTCCHMLTLPLLACAVMQPGYTTAAASVFGIDAPELAAPGPFAVGVRTLSFVQRDQPDVLAFDARTGSAPRRDRTLRVLLWYPAQPQPGSKAITYQAALPSLTAAPVAFSIPGMAVSDAPVAGRDYPLVIISHGYSNAPEAMAWLAENLASKGYVVAAIAHDDPPITDVARYVGPILRRPLDIVFVAHSLRQQLGAQHLINPQRLALIGYSMGGYGVLTAAGARFDPNSPLMSMVPGGLLVPYAGAQREAVVLSDVQAVVAIAPLGGGPRAAWGAQGLQGIRAPLLLIAGNRDHTVDYESGAHTFFTQATHAERFLLTFKEAGHALALAPLPDAMRTRLWDLEWFEDPVWRKERISGINAHFITAFLDRYVKGDTTRAAYLEVANPDSDAGAWDLPSPLPYDAYSPGDDKITVWKGFQRNHAAGLELLRAPAAR